MKLEINFTTVAAAAAFITSLTDAQKTLLDGTDRPPVGITPAMQEAARASAMAGTAKAGAAEPKSEPRVVPAYEKSGLATLVMEAQIKNKDATAAVLTKHGGVIDGKPNAKALKPETFEAVRTELKAIIDAATDTVAAAVAGASTAAADEPKPTYDQSGIREMIQKVQAKAKAAGSDELKNKLVETIRAHGGIGPDGKTLGAAIPPENFAAALRALTALQQD